MNSVAAIAPAVTSCPTCGDVLEPQVVHGAHNRLYTIQAHANNVWCAEYGRQGWLETLERLYAGGASCVASWYATVRAFHAAEIRLGLLCGLCGTPTTGEQVHADCADYERRAEVA